MQNTFYYSISFSQLCTYTNFNESERSFARRARYFRAVQYYLACLAREYIYVLSNRLLYACLFWKNKTSHGSKLLVFAENHLKNCTHCWATKTKSREQRRRKASSAPNLIVRYQGPVKNLLCKTDFAHRVQVRI